MTLIELKESLHKKIDNLNDPDYLEMLDRAIEHKSQVFQIPESHLADIKQGEEDLKNGAFLTLEQLEKRYEKWLKD
jgi:hypothetical protein